MTSTTGGSVLLIDRGDLPALAALVTQPDPGRVLIWHPREGDVAADRRRAAALAHAGIIGREAIIEAELDAVDEPPVDTGVGEILDGLGEGLMLVRAAAAAISRGCGMVVWPAQVGPDSGRITAAVERATLVGELAGIGGAGTLTIDVPLIDLDDRQVLDLADDGGAPLTAFWPCDRGGPEPCRGCLGCSRWQEAFAEAGMPWPWEAARAR